MARMGWAEFWPYYLQEHSDGTNRAIHVAGTTVAFGCLVAFAFTLWAWFLLIGLLTGYAAAWVGHFVFQKNRPATFQYPIKSFCYDWRMWALAVTGRIGREYERLDVDRT